MTTTEIPDLLECGRCPVSFKLEPLGQRHTDECRTRTTCEKCGADGPVIVVPTMAQIERMLARNANVEITLFELCGGCAR